MSAEAWIGLAGLAVVVLTSVVTGAFVLGQHSQKISQTQADIRDLKKEAAAATATDTALQVLTEGVNALKGQVRDLRLEVRRRMGGPASAAED